MKKIFVLATAALLLSSASFADNGKNKKRPTKGKTCSEKTCNGKTCTKEKDKAAKI